MDFRVKEIIHNIKKGQGYPIVLISIILLFVPIVMQGQKRLDSIPSLFTYALTFETNFDNREYRPIAPSPSRTIFGSRVAPSVGVFLPSKKIDHSVMAGADIMREFGQSLGESIEGYQLKAIQFFYRMNGLFGTTNFTMITGAFPKSFGRRYPSAFVSDSLRFYDSNYEGLLMTFSRPNAYYEIGCDWIGLYERLSRERFMLFSQGETKIRNRISVGYYVNLFHYAGCQEVKGVVDNILIYPWIGFDISGIIRLHKAAFKIGWLQAAQNDRRNIGRYTFPGGVQLSTELASKNFGVKNEYYYGRGLMPYYDKTDVAGNKYGSSLYYGDSFYRIIQGKQGAYDRLELFYEPKIADFIYLKVSMVAHLGKEYMGWQQCFSLIFDIH